MVNYGYFGYGGDMGDKEQNHVFPSVVENIELVAIRHSLRGCWETGVQRGFGHSSMN